MIRAAIIIVLALALQGCAVSQAKRCAKVVGAKYAAACGILYGAKAGKRAFDLLKGAVEKNTGPATNGEDMATRWRKFCANTEKPQDYPQCAPNGEAEVR